MFWLSNMKQLNFGHFNTDSKKFTVTVIFFPEQNKNKNSSKFKANIICFLVNQGVFGNSPTIPDYIRRFPKTTEDSQKLAKISKDY